MPDEKLIKNFLHTLSRSLRHSVFSPTLHFSAKQSMMNNKGENLIN